MKLFKKVLAAALAGVLALSVLTGCNNSAATVTMVDALNDWAKIYGVDTTFEKGDEKLQAQVEALVKIVDEAGKKIDFKDAKDFDDVRRKVMENDAAWLKLKDWAKQFTKANIGDGSPLYGYGFADISAALSASNSKNIYYADQLITSETPINPPDTEWVGGLRVTKVMLPLRPARLAVRSTWSSSSRLLLKRIRSIIRIRIRIKIDKNDGGIDEGASED